MTVLRSAATLLAQLDVLLELRPNAKRTMIVEARRHPGWKSLRSIPFPGPIRVAQILAIIRTPFRFRTKRDLWPYAGLAVGHAFQCGPGSSPTEGGDAGGERLSRAV